VRGFRFPSHVILRPVFFMENLVAPFSLQGDRLSSALGPSTRLQMIAVDDIGWFGARAFTDAAALNRREIRVRAFDMVASPRQFERLNRHLTQGRVRVPITARYSLGKAAQAHWRLARQHVLGRMVLQIRRDGSRP